MAALLLPAWAGAQPLQQRTGFTHADTLRGSNGPYRAWWDVVHYDLSIQPDPVTRTVHGTNSITLRTLVSGQRMQIDLQQPLVVDSIKADMASAFTAPVIRGNELVPFTREGDVVWVDLPAPLSPGSTFLLHIYYHGTPREAQNPPWDGGWIWKTDAQGYPWMTVACQGLGASVWYPCKDIQSDEPDSALLHITVPTGLQGVGNGRLRSTADNGNGSSTWTWAVTNPINTYNLVPYIGRYAHFHAAYQGLGGPLDLDYWVLQDHEAKAREQFKQVPGMLQCFENWFGPYPFYRDGYKLVEAPHLGMEHQSAVAYGNHYLNGYLGKDLSGSGWGLQWDFIIIHESAHEWWGNSITSADIADMWVHESFTNYAEALYTECRFGKAAGEDYVIGLRANIANDIPITGPYGVNQEGSGDMYYKGANMVHTIRHIMANDSLFKAMLREMNRRYRHTTVTGAQVEDFISAFSGRDFSALFEQYLRTTRIPELQWTVHRGKLYVRFANCVDGFAMPVTIMVNGEERTVPINERWSSPAHGLNDRTATLVADRNWYIQVKRTGPAALKQERAR